MPVGDESRSNAIDCVKVHLLYHELFDVDMEGCCKPIPLVLEPVSLSQGTATPMTKCTDAKATSGCVFCNMGSLFQFSMKQIHERVSEQISEFSLTKLVEDHNLAFVNASMRRHRNV